MAVGNQQGIVGAVRFDLKRLHETWMELVFPRQRDVGDTVLGKWRPKDTRSKITYNLWSALGVPVIAVLYPLALLGVIVRFQSRRIDNTATRLGIGGVVLLTLVVWGGLTVLARFELDLATGGVIAVGAASGVAVVSAGLAALLHKFGGRFTTVLLAYPFTMTAIFLPPVVAALYSPTIAEVVLPRSDTFARWLLWDVLDVVGLSDFFVDNFEREGFAYVAMWFGIAVPVGWLLGTLVTLADFVRPK